MKTVFEFAPATYACRSCGSTTGQADCGPELFLGSGQRLQLCEACGLGYLSPDFTDASLNEFYARHYRRLFLIDAARTHDDLFFQRNMYRDFAMLRVAETAPRLPKGARLLELGSGFGSFLGQLHALRPDIELFATETDEAHRLHLLDGAPVTFVDPARIADDGPYDAIVAFHVVEHLKHPVADLALATSCLKPKGFIIVEVPDSLGPWGSWSFVQPAHVSYFTPASLRGLMVRAGLSVEQSGRNPIGTALADTIWAVGHADLNGSQMPEGGSPAELAAFRMQLARNPVSLPYRLKRLARRAAVLLIGPDRLGAIQRYRYWKANRHLFQAPAPT